MTAIELLKHGIETQNWEDIQKVYAMFTGLPVERAVDKQTKKTKKNTKSKATKEQTKTVPIDEYDVNNYIITGNKANPASVDADGRRKARTEPVNVGKIKSVGNMFTDELNIATSDIEIDRKIHNKPLVPRRQAPQQKVYTCTGECGRKVKFFPSQVPTGEYKCVQCIQQTKRS